MTRTNEHRPLGAAGVGVLSFHSRIVNPKHKPPPHSPQAKSSVVDARDRFGVPAKVLEFPAHRLEVRINATNDRAPYGRSEPFHLRPRDLDSLIRIAARLEGRP
jgi:hypothetical protein